MPRIKCTYCGRGSQEKMATLYVAWFTPDGVRTAHRLRCCGECSKEAISELLNSALDSDSACPLCHQPVSDDAELAWVTAFFPHHPPIRYELAFCGACGSRWRGSVLATGDHLRNRDGYAVPGIDSGARAPEWAWVRDLEPDGTS